MTQARFPRSTKKRSSKDNRIGGKLETIASVAGWMLQFCERKSSEKREKKKKNSQRCVADTDRDVAEETLTLKGQR